MSLSQGPSSGLQHGPRPCLVRVPGSGDTSGHQPPCSAVSAATATAASGLLSQPLSSSWCRALSATPGLGHENPTFLQPGDPRGGEDTGREVGAGHKVTQVTATYRAGPRVCMHRGSSSVTVPGSCQLAVPSVPSSEASCPRMSVNGGACSLLSETTVSGTECCLCGTFGKSLSLSGLLWGACCSPPRSYV